MAAEPESATATVTASPMLVAPGRDRSRPGCCRSSEVLIPLLPVERWHHSEPGEVLASGPNRSIPASRGYAFRPASAVALRAGARLIRSYTRAHEAHQPFECRDRPKLPSPLRAAASERRHRHAERAIRGTSRPPRCGLRRFDAGCGTVTLTPPARPARPRGQRARSFCAIAIVRGGAASPPFAFMCAKPNYGIIIQLSCSHSDIIKSGGCWPALMLTLRSIAHGAARFSAGKGCAGTRWQSKMALIQERATRPRRIRLNDAADRQPHRGVHEPPSTFLQDRHAQRRGDALVRGRA